METGLLAPSVCRQHVICKQSLPTVAASLNIPSTGPFCAGPGAMVWGVRGVQNALLLTVKRS